VSTVYNTTIRVPPWKPQNDTFTLFIA